VKIQCKEHKWVDWEGHVVCSDCLRVYQTKDESKPLFAPMVCVCGSKLMPDRNPGDGGKGKKKKFSARSCCPACFEERVGAQVLH
jgi:hypothetical protein